MARALSQFAWFLLAGLALPAFAAKTNTTITTITVDQMDPWLARAGHKSDTKRARGIADLRLSERATPTELAHWEAEFPGAHTRDALLALADASQFLALAQNQISKTPPPDIPAQVAMLSRAVQYSVKAVSKLPDFFATRETLHFEDMPAQTSSQLSISMPDASLGARASSLPTPLHLTERWKIVVTYRNGSEVPVKKFTWRNKLQSAERFTTSGEFGPILLVVLGDAVHGKIEWGYWQERLSNPEAVFRYSVPRNQSHYTVQFPDFRPPILLHPAYHGEIAIDPATGTILRLTVIADPKPPYQRFQAEMMVIYAPVAIGGKTYICPVRAVAISKMPVAETSPDPNHTGPLTGSLTGPLQTQLNDVSFTNYHLFRAEMTILP